jgi:hypothetical protein
MNEVNVRFRSISGSRYFRQCGHGELSDYGWQVKLDGGCHVTRCLYHCRY